MKNLALIFGVFFACVTAPPSPESPKGPNGIDQPKKEKNHGSR